ncbi:MAG: Kelch repeat-containing protein [Alphaproteobacteria bacterium]
MNKVKRGLMLAGAASALLVAVACGAQEQSATWAVKGTMPFSRAETVAVEVDGKIYVLSGHIAGTQATSFTQEYDPATQEWRDLPFMPYVASHAGAAAVDGKIYHVGGFVANVHVGAHDRVYEFDTATENWRQVAALSAPRGSAGVVALNGRIHAIGGRDPGIETVDTHEIYDPATDSWTLAAPLPVARDHLGIVVLDGKIHVFGGRTGATMNPVARHDVYDPATDSWCKTPDADVRLTFDEVEVYDPASDSWTELPLMAEGRHATAVVTMGDEGLVIGGNAGCGGGLRRDTVLSFTFN